MKSLTEQQKIKARQILAQTTANDLLWFIDAAQDAYEKVIEKILSEKVVVPGA